MEKTTLKVLMIDDDPEDYFLVKDLLSLGREARYDVQWVGSSEKGIAAIRQQAADVYIIDYTLDTRNGLDILDSLEGFTTNKPIIFLTAQDDLKIDLAAMEKGASDFLTKIDLNRDQLERSIRYSIKRMKDQNLIRESVLLKAATDIANQAKSHFLATVSHEMRAPLAAIAGFADLSLDSETTPSERADYARVIKRNAHELLDLLNETLDTAKVESGQVDVRIESFHWWDVLQEVLQTFKPKADSKYISSRSPKKLACPICFIRTRDVFVK